MCVHILTANEARPRIYASQTVTCWEAVPRPQDSEQVRGVVLSKGDNRTNEMGLVL